MSYIDFASVERRFSLPLTLMVWSEGASNPARH